MKVFLCLLLLAVATYASVPTSFDSRKKWSGCEFSILNQHSCGGCWAFCSAESFADRLCVTQEAKNSTIISMEPILECSGHNCGGGSPHEAWSYMIDHGTTTCTNHCTSGCAPFDSSKGSSPKCHAGTCDSGSKWPHTYKPSYFHYMNTTSSSYSMSDVQNHLMKYGPMGASFAVYQNFHSFFNEEPAGIYNRTSGSQSGRHCVKLIGWGHESGMDYWLFANSWGTSWGVKGYFKMIRGKNLCGIEEKFSEGYTKSQHSSLSPQELEFNSEEIDPTKAEEGAWIVHSEEWLDSFNGVASQGINLFFGAPQGAFEVIGARTQVVAGTNFDLTVRIGEKTVVLELYQDQFLNVSPRW